MSYIDLSEKLLQLGERIAKHSGKMEGEKLGRSALRLSLELERFTESLEMFLVSRKSGELELETILCSPTARKHLSIELVRQGLREIVGKRLRSEDLASAKREFVDSIHDSEKSSKAAEFLREAFAAAAHVHPLGKDKLHLQQEFLRLGRLAEEEFDHEIGTRTFGALRRLAEANGIAFTDKTTKGRLTSLIRRFARRAALNVIAK